MKTSSENKDERRFQDVFKTSTSRRMFGERKVVLVIFLILQETTTPLKKQRIPFYLIKSVLKRTSTAIFNMKKVDLDES